MSSTTVVPLLISFLFISTLPPCRPLSFSYNFSDPRTFDGSNIITVGTATLAQKDVSLIELTQNPDPTVEGVSNAVGRATYSKPMLLWDKATGEVTSFTTRFSFAIKHASDGIAFFLSSYPPELPPYHGGKYLGLVDGSTNATPAVVAVEFDTFHNDWDPYTDHIGIDVNSINSTAVEVLPMGTLTDRSEPMIALVSYNSSMKLLAVALQLERTDGGMRYELNSTVDLKSLLPPEVAIGFSAASGYSTELHRVLAWSFNSTLMEMNLVPAGTRPMPNKVPHFPSKRMIWVVAGAAGAAMLISVAFVGVLIRWFLMMRRRRRMNEEQAIADLEVCSMDDELKFENGAGPRRFRYGELAAATNNISEDGKLGEGGFGSVYKGSLSDLGVDVAVKRISKSSRQGRKEYVSEVTIISRLRHRNLVELVGWCHSNGELLLVYELVPNGSLDARLYGKGGSVLRWPSRYEIALGLGSALLYLHVECKKCVVHRDVKPSNVMLDASLGAKLGDFGLAKLLDHGSSLPTVVLAGTMGYMDPEYTASGRASTASDVYSFGIVLLEMCCGRRPRDDSVKPSLLEWVWDLYGRGAALEAADKRLDGDLDQAQMQRVLVVGLWCAHPDRGVRPSIKQALGVLQLEAPLPVLPRKMPVPTFSTSVAGPDADADGSTGRAGVYSSSMGR
ncbi:L-type lectin-domain containing receptor kinase IX.1-like [Triticum aestivum]|nr:L-type lectin-domain containing receptor kinase IX.1-like [Triticum aestivum]